MNAARRQHLSTVTSVVVKLGTQLLTASYAGDGLDFRDLAPFAEDLGRKARAWQVECYVLGDDYFAQRDALIRELSKAGAVAVVASAQPPTLDEPDSGWIPAKYGGAIRFVRAPRR